MQMMNNNKLKIKLNYDDTRWAAWLCWFDWPNMGDANPLQGVCNNLFICFQRVIEHLKTAEY